MSAAADFPEWRELREEAARQGDENYADFVAAYSLDYYRRRLRALGMTGHGDVLDVGAGFGQWSAALAAENGNVVSLEIHANRLGLSRGLTRRLGFPRVRQVRASASALPFADASFDALFCYGVLMFLDRETTLAEFARVLRPGGRLYVCTNGPGWWLKLAVERRRGAPSVSRYGWSAFRKRGEARAIPNSTRARDARKWLPGSEWSDVSAGAEGSLGAPGPDTPPVYDARYAMFDNVIEFTADRVGARKPRPAGPMRRALGACEATLSASHVDHLALLREFPIPRPIVDGVNDRNPLAVDLALRDARGVDRLEALRAIFAMIVEGRSGKRDRIEAAIRFAQTHFYHHFAGQAMKGGGVVVADPVASLLIRACRCGNAARFLVDLFEANGFAARLLGGACHTSAEVELDGRFVLAEASLYPPGVFPLNGAGDLLSLGEAAADHWLLDKPPNYVNYNARHIEAFRAAYPEAYAPIARWLEAPIPPSVAFFGARFHSGRPVSAVQRWRKARTPDAWNGLEDFGWEATEPLASAQGPALATMQRPGQVTRLRREGGRLAFDAPTAAPDMAPIAYDVALSRVSRGWDWDAIPVTCDFTAPGEVLRAQGASLELPPAFAEGPLFVTVTARGPMDLSIFNLPSREFVFGDEATAGAP